MHTTTECSRSLLTRRHKRTIKASRACNLSFSNQVFCLRITAGAFPIMSGNFHFGGGRRFHILLASVTPYVVRRSPDSTYWSQLYQKDEFHFSNQVDVPLRGYITGRTGNSSASAGFRHLTLTGIHCPKP